MTRHPSKFQKLLDHVYQLLQPWKGEVHKATTAGITAAGLSLLALVGVTGEMTVLEVLTALSIGVVDYFFTWLKKNTSQYETFTK